MSVLIKKLKEYRGLVRVRNGGDTVDLFPNKGNILTRGNVPIHTFYISKSNAFNLPEIIKCPLRNCPFCANNKWQP